MKNFHITKAVETVTPKKCEIKPADEKEEFQIVLWDFGAKENIIREMTRRGCRVADLPAGTTAEEILKMNPDGIMLSNGPGDPKECTDIITEIRKLYESEVPIFAICLGHQLMALATGADTHKLKYGHRGGNHPVKDLETGRVYISSQNHGYVVDEESVKIMNLMCKEKKQEINALSRESSNRSRR
mgnify:CR=1 FL=1